MQFVIENRHPICVRNIDSHIALQHTVTIELVQIKTYACFVWEGCSPHASSSSQLDIYVRGKLGQISTATEQLAKLAKKGPEQKANSTLPISVGQSIELGHSQNRTEKRSLASSLHIKFRARPKCIVWFCNRSRPHGSKARLPLL